MLFSFDIPNNTKEQLCWVIDKSLGLTNETKTNKIVA